MELLIVISIILILMLVAIPTAGKIRKHANELSASKVAANASNKLNRCTSPTYPANGLCVQLCRPSAATPAPVRPAPRRARVINGELATGIKSGYIFNITNCTKVTVNNGDRITSFTATAVPATLGKTGDRGFCLESGGAMKADPAGGTNCTQMVQ